MRRLIALATVLFVVLAACAASRGDSTSHINRKPSVEINFVDASAVKTDGVTTGVSDEAEFTIRFDVTARGKDIKVAPFTVLPEMGPAYAQFQFFGSGVGVASWTGTMNHTGSISDNGYLLVRRGETERFTFVIYIAQFENDGFVGVGIDRIGWDTAPNWKHHFQIVGTKGGGDFATPLLYVSVPED